MVLGELIDSHVWATDRAHPRPPRTPNRGVSKSATADWVHHVGSSSHCNHHCGDDFVLMLCICFCLISRVMRSVVPWRVSPRCSIRTIRSCQHSDIHTANSWSGTAHVEAGGWKHCQGYFTSSLQKKKLEEMCSVLSFRVSDLLKPFWLNLVAFHPTLAKAQTGKVEQGC